MPILSWYAIRVSPLVLWKTICWMLEQHYKHGQMGLAYEMVINSNPCIAYLMEENTMTMQALVIAHACYGHNSFFKNNYLFKTVD